MTQHKDTQLIQQLSAKRAHLTDSIRQLKIELREEEQELADINDKLLELCNDR